LQNFKSKTKILLSSFIICAHDKKSCLPGARCALPLPMPPAKVLPEEPLGQGSRNIGFIQRIESLLHDSLLHDLLHLLKGDQVFLAVKTKSSCGENQPQGIT